MRAVAVWVPVLIEETASVGPQGRQALNSAGAGCVKNEDRVGRSRNEDRVGRRHSVEQAAHSQQRWHPLEDGSWGRVVGRVGAGRKVVEAIMIGKGVVLLQVQNYLYRMVLDHLY